MKFIGISRTFSTLNDGQYNTIGAFWDEMSAKYGIEALRGLGFNWTENTIEYVIGLKQGTIPNADKEIELPDDGWQSVHGRTEDLGRIYEAIYRDGPLQYEIETFTRTGECGILYYRSSMV